MSNLILIISIVALVASVYVTRHVRKVRAAVGLVSAALLLLAVITVGLCSARGFSAWFRIDRYALCAQFSDFELSLFLMERDGPYVLLRKWRPFQDDENTFGWDDAMSPGELANVIVLRLPYVVLGPLALFMLYYGGRILVQRFRRRRLTHCKCGYDLTGTTSPTCPECGAAIKVHVPVPQQSA